MNDQLLPTTSGWRFRTALSAFTSFVFSIIHESHALCPCHDLLEDSILVYCPTPAHQSVVISVSPK